MTVDISNTTSRGKWPACVHFKSGHARNMTVLRILLCSALIIAAAACSVGAYFLLEANQSELLHQQYNSISTSAIDSVVNNYNRMNLGLKGMANTYSFVFPNASDWPNAAWPGFSSTANHLAKVSALDNIAFSPIVQPAELAEYEAFMKTYYENDPTVVIPERIVPWIELGMVWNLTWNQFFPLRDTTGQTPWSDRTYLTPAAQFTYSDAIGPQYLSYNMHSFERFAPVFDAIVDCVAASNVTVAQANCGAVSDTVAVPFANFYFPEPEVIDVQAQLAHPIFPAQAPTKLVGFISGAVSWKSLLKLAVPIFADGLDFVISTDQEAFTYRITDGVPKLAGVGDLHDRAYSSYKKTALLQSNTLISGVNGVQYKISLFPRDSFVRQYTSIMPIYAAIALVGVFVICAAIFVCYDVSMHRESDRKQAILDTKRRFVRFISHEIRTPLNTVRLGMKLFEAEIASVGASIAKAPPADLHGLIGGALRGWKHLVDDVLTNSETAVEVLDDLLNYDKIEVGSLRLEYSIFNIYDLVKKTASIMQIQAQQKNIHLELINAQSVRSSVTLGTASVHGAMVGASFLSGAFIIGDSYRMGQVLRNLISNALKFTPVDGTVTITADLVENGLPNAACPKLEGSTASLLGNTTRAGSIVIAVKDSGAGLTPKQLEEIGAEGVQFNANELQAGQGSGLGLYISKGIVEQHGGRLSVTSEGLGLGVTFTVELPVYREPARRGSVVLAGVSSSLRKYATDTGPAETTNRSFDGVIFSGSEEAPRPAQSRRMLVVDDSPFNRKMLVRLLVAKGNTCHQAEDGAAALKVYGELIERGEPPDVILMDFEMPVMNGPTATARLREMGCTCLIVGVTGNVLPDDVQYFRDCGADHVLPKPLALEDFELLLRRHANSTHRNVSATWPEALNARPVVKKEATLHALSAGSSRGGSNNRILPVEEVV